MRTVCCCVQTVELAEYRERTRFFVVGKLRHLSGEFIPSCVHGVSAMAKACPGELSLGIAAEVAQVE